MSSDHEPTYPTVDPTPPASLAEAEDRGRTEVAREVLRAVLAAGARLDGWGERVSGKVIRDALGESFIPEEVDEIVESILCKDEDCRAVLTFDDEASGRDGLCLRCVEAAGAHDVAVLEAAKDAQDHRAGWESKR